MKTKILIRQLFLFFLILSSAFSQEKERFTKINWSQLQLFPNSFRFDGEVTGYLSIFKTPGGWQVFLYKTRAALQEHEEMSFFRISDIEFGNALGIVAFTGNEKLLKSLDQRFVRIAGSFGTAEMTIAEVPYYIDKISSLSWRGKDGTWTSDQTNGLSEPPLKEGRLLAFPDVIFFKHDDHDDHDD